MDFTRIKESLLLWSLGVIQPASPIEIAQIIERIASSELPPGAVDGIAKQCDHYVNRGLLRLVNKHKKWYSLTYEGDLSLPRELRHRRDRIRLYLLKEAWKFRIPSGGVLNLQKTIDDSSINGKNGDNIIQDVPRPTKSGDALTRDTTFRWPRIFEQINKGSGFASSTSSLLAPNPLTFYSFSALHKEKAYNPYPINAVELALAIGISARLLTSIDKAPDRHYRRFQIPKADGTFRDIASPRLFLKVIQYWIKDYLLFRLPVHESCYSFLKSVSIANNAAPHVGKKYVATIDVENFFGSINQKAVEGLIKKAGYTRNLARIISKLTTLKDALPQGAPTSPIISNSYLYRMDQSHSKWCVIRGCSYTRYADDITISGNNRDTVTKCIERATQLLNRYGLRLKESKTRIQSRGGRQVVTGLVVNEKAQPTREQRRMVRAMLNRYQKGLMKDSKDISCLKGWLSYFRSFEHLKEKYEKI